jgi:hypothetical protein
MTNPRDQGHRAVAATLQPVGFEPEGSWTLVELVEASAEVWEDLADEEADVFIAAGYRAMAKDLARFAAMLDAERSRNHRGRHDHLHLD